MWNNINEFSSYCEQETLINNLALLIESMEVLFWKVWFSEEVEKILIKLLKDIFYQIKNVWSIGWNVDIWEVKRVLDSINIEFIDLATYIDYFMIIRSWWKICWKNDLITINEIFKQPLNEILEIFWSFDDKKSKQEFIWIRDFIKWQVFINL